MAVPPTIQKQQLRDRLRAARRALVRGRDDDRSLAGTVHYDILQALIESRACVAGYWPMPTEPDSMPLLIAANKSGAVTALPRIDPITNMLNFCRWNPFDLTEKYKSFQQPLIVADVVQPDIILAPLMGFDRALNRLGQGGGHYDRAFTAYPKALKIGIAWSVQEVAALPAEPHDVPLDAVLTEKEWITL